VLCRDGAQRKGQRDEPHRVPRDGTSHTRTIASGPRRFLNDPNLAARASVTRPTNTSARRAGTVPAAFPPRVGRVV
jgi:hypothetical protein